MQPLASAVLQQFVEVFNDLHENSQFFGRAGLQEQQSAVYGKPLIA